MTIQIDPLTGERIKQANPVSTSVQIDPLTGERVKPDNKYFSGTPQVNPITIPENKTGKIISGIAEGTGIPAVVRSGMALGSTVPVLNQVVKNPYKGMGASEVIAQTAPAAVPMLGLGGMALGGIAGGAMAASGLDEKMSKGIQKINSLVSNNAPATAVLGTIEDLLPIALAVMGGKRPSKVGKFEGIVGKEVIEAGPQALTQDIFDKVKTINKKAGEKIGGVKQYIAENPESVILKEGQYLPLDLKNKITDIYSTMKPSLSDNARATFEQFIREAEAIESGLPANKQWESINNLRERFGAMELEKANPTKGTNKIYKAFMEVLEDSVPENQKGILKEANKEFSETIRLTEEFKTNAFGDIKESFDLTSQPGLTEALKKYSQWEIKNKLLGQIHENAFNATGEFDKVKLGKYLNKINRNKLAQEVLGNDFVEIQKLSTANPNKFQTMISQLMNNRLFGAAKPLSMAKQAVGEYVMPGQEFSGFTPAVIGAQAEIQSSPQGRKTLLERRKQYLKSLEERKK